ncbi:hypothetical protein E2C01_056295 [Portunus trituberculatus]|uniref:Uncharacterized protein n=1 Tax=Portunus trituberculatus TaxID=210409 RepID=A0A5B7GTQ2_PORTR|nr:hypothetical protein [Portunus trituberculatus]
MSCIHAEDLIVLAPVAGIWGHRFKLAHLYSSLKCHKCFFSLRKGNAVPAEFGCPHFSCPFSPLWHCTSQGVAYQPSLCLGH